MDHSSVIETMKLEQTRMLREKGKECDQRMAQGDLLSFPNISCPPFWDTLLCWDRAPAGSLQVQNCPSYVFGFKPQANATRLCTEDGTWFSQNGINTFTNFSLCVGDPEITIITQSNRNISYIEPYLPTVNVISKVGYTLSLLSLVVAFIIFASIKRLRCPRNVLHMHLFASFILKASLIYLQEFVQQSNLGLASITVQGEDSKYFINEDLEVHWMCKMVVTLWQYFIMANYAWILMEGLYLHSLIFLALFTDSSAITHYVTLGWGLPVIFVLPWAILRAIFENKLCWTTHDNTIVFLLIKVPIMASVVINFVLFINIVRVLLRKLKSSVNEETRIYRRWAKSTLILVPLFGVHYMLFLGFTLSSDKTAEIVWLFCDQLFASFNGFFVALLYCFLNGEVRTELSKKLNKFSTRYLPEESHLRTLKVCNCCGSSSHSRKKNDRHFSGGSSLSISITSHSKEHKVYVAPKRPGQHSLKLSPVDHW